jgi:hypothetical protein
MPLPAKALRNEGRDEPAARPASDMVAAFNEEDLPLRFALAAQDTRVYNTGVNDHRQVQLNSLAQFYQRVAANPGAARVTRVSGAVLARNPAANVAAAAPITSARAAGSRSAQAVYQRSQGPGAPQNAETTLAFRQPLVANRAALMAGEVCHQYSPDSSGRS